MKKLRSRVTTGGLDRAPLARLMICSFVAAIIASSFLWSYFAYDLISTSGEFDTYNLNAGLLFAFFSCFVATIARLIYLIVTGQREFKKIICCLVFLVGACASLWINSSIYPLEDYVFFKFEESNFRTKLPSASNGQLVVVHMRSSANFHKVIAYSDRLVIPDGELPLELIDAYGSEFAGLRGCQMVSRSLGDRFYVLRAFC